MIPVPAGTQPGMPAGIVGIAGCEAAAVTTGPEEARSAVGLWLFVATGATGSGSPVTDFTSEVLVVEGVAVTLEP